MTDVTAEDSVQGDEQQPARDPVDQQLVDRLASRANVGGLHWLAKAGCWSPHSGVSSPTTSATTATAGRAGQRRLSRRAPVRDRVDQRGRGAGRLNPPECPGAMGLSGWA
jgi:hypothetical protein